MKIKGKDRKYVAQYYYIQDGGEKAYLGEMSLFTAACKAQKIAKAFLAADFGRRETELVVTSPELEITTTITAIRNNNKVLVYNK